MEAVGREAAASPPLAFPWVRAVPGLLATIAAVAVAIWHGIASLTNPTSFAVFAEQLRQLAALATGMGLQWVLLALTITILSVMLPLRLTRVGNSALP
jgi:hypothetical protein